jgi:predicted dienelactone hydrolase
MRQAALLVLLLALSTEARASGFQWASAPDPDGAALALAIWYPSAATPGTHAEGPFELNVAENAPVAGSGLPLVVFSHGTGGSPLPSAETAAALADAGFVVAAVMHRADNYQDSSIAFGEQNFISRPRQLSRVIDYMLAGWSGHAAIDPARIGIFGHSAGGATALLAIGGTLDWPRVVAYCASHADDWGCQMAREHPAAPPPAPLPDLVTGADPRIKAAVVAAPAVAAGFGPAGLAAVHVPVQLWIGTKDRYVPDSITVTRLLPAGYDAEIVPGAGHFAFLDPCRDSFAAIAPAVCEDPPGFDRAAFQKGFRAKLIAFFKRTL